VVVQEVHMLVPEMRHLLHHLEVLVDLDQLIVEVVVEEELIIMDLLVLVVPVLS
jgi:hypothetical protein